MSKGQYNPSTITLPAQAVADLQLDVNGNLKIVGGGTGASAGQVQGNSASGVADVGNPVKTGGVYNTTAPVFTNGQRGDTQIDASGNTKVVQAIGPATTANLVSGVISSAMTGTTSTLLLAAPGANLRNYITQITVSNSHATVGTDLIVQDGSGGTTLYVIPAAAVYGGAAISFPQPLRQPTANTALYIANVTTGSSTKASASGYSAA